MFVYEDLSREVIAHFVGSLYLSVEEARVRQEYLEFRAVQSVDQQEENVGLVTHTLMFKGGYDLPILEPDVFYEYPFSVLLPEIPEQINPYFQDLDFRASLYKVDPVWGSFPRQLPGKSEFKFEIKFINEPVLPNNVGVVVNFSNYLSDNDYLSNTDLEILFPNHAPSVAGTYAELLENNSIHVFGTPAAPPTESDIATIVENWAEAAVNLQNSGPGVGQQVLASGEAVQNVHVNGEIFDERIDYSTVIENLKGHEAEDDEEKPVDSDLENSPKKASGEFEEETQTGLGTPSLRIEAGGNVLNNTAVLTDIWGKASVISVTGDYYDLDLISQTNVILEQDQSFIIGVDNEAPFITEGSTQSFNLASITHSDTALPMDWRGGTNPANWDVTFHQGDLTFLNWMKQTNYLTDNDTIIYQEDGSGTSIISGENVLANTLSLSQLSDFYDLIIIDGSYYSANVISQSNVFINYDTFLSDGSIAADEDARPDQINNLLWNDAYIISNYQADVTELNSELSGQLSGASGSDVDAEFLAAAYGSSTTLYNHLNVLYVSGDVFDVNYVEQTNVLGDSDDLAIFDVDLAGDQTQINTDSNILYNAAVIQEVGVETTIKVAGQQYSEAVLYQAEIITNDTDFVDVSPQSLASEAVVFLADGMISKSEDKIESVNLNQIPDEVSADPMTTLIA
ncbi:MAG: hypothetical protein ABJQ71_08480 [Roseibium sp.]